jgi:acetyl-CoA C-acetyltransferase
MAPALALPQLCTKLGLRVAEIDVFEIHEAFAAQVLCNMKVWRDGWSRYPHESVLGEIPVDKINIFGGSIALGHPFSATGGRLLINTCQALRERGGRRGVISVCAAGGGGAASRIDCPRLRPPRLPRLRVT